MNRRYLLNFTTRDLPQYTTDCLVVGTGVAGLLTAWQAAQAGAEVTLLVKRELTDSNSQQAQGGIAAALGAQDSPELHEKDTLVAGAGLCEHDAVDILVHEGRERVQQLMELGVNFDRDEQGLCLTREGCHSRKRVLHAQGDATGAEIVRALIGKVTTSPRITILENHYAVDLLVKENVCHGLLAYDSRSLQLKALRAGAVVLATGGAGQLYSHTTNPQVATADGIAMAYRAGAEVMDMEFMQFHPTALAVDGLPSFLISEAVRGEGAVLRNEAGERFMTRYHEMAELAPRDVVARAIHSEMVRTGTSHVLLDVRELGRQTILQRFPTIAATCDKYGLDITEQPLPVAPAAHYLMGGVKINLHGQTSIDRLYCCGEASCSGVHGANRLASNSLLDGLVFATRIAQDVSLCKRNQLGQAVEFSHDACAAMPAVDFADIHRQLQQVMTEQVSLVRTEQGLTAATAFFSSYEGSLKAYAATDIMQMEVLNMLEVGKLICSAALLRTESRGGHFRSDFPEPLPVWERHVLLKR